MDEEEGPRSFESLVVEREKLLQLKRILLALLEKMTQRLTYLANEIDTITSVDMLKEKRKDCQKIIEAAKALFSHDTHTLQPSFLVLLNI
jgi:hypothetical protein